MAHDVFISYSSKDKTIADAVCARLEARGIRCWIAPRDVTPGAPYGEEIIDGIHNARAMVLVLSSNANASPHIPKEIERAVSRALPIIPLRVEDVMPAKSLDYFISSVHWLDAITPPLEGHLDSLANTLRTLLPEGQRTPPPVDPVPQPVAPTPPPPSASKPKWLIPGLAAAAIALAAGWFIWGRPSSSDTSSATNSYNAPANANPTPGLAPANNYHAPQAPASGGDPLVGCWHWYNNATVSGSPDGTAIAGPFKAHWQLSDPRRRIYRFTWPEAVDSVTVSGDGNNMSGGNQYGFRTSATRISPGPGIAGFWRWFNGVTVAISSDGRFTVGNITGHWQMTGQGAYALTWPDPVDTVTISSDHSKLAGANQYGVRVSATKLPGCGG